MSDYFKSSNENESITIAATINPDGSDRILVRGRFSVSCGENGVPDQSLDTLKHLVLVVTRAANYQALTPFQETVVFEDDVR
ncbi:hypothetical protein ACXYTJ_00380 [Gilvimarinus sp. F26214L]|uniref:hypothetical protein n=1 Tax=Gilvimarinus sp. DZF01 TaxID=3461371 RepID=UPI0040458C8C